MKRFRFYKENNKWFVDLPNYECEQSDLEMVMGADKMLDIISEGDNDVWLYVSKKYFNNFDKLIFIGLATDIGDGAYYIFKKYKGIELNLDIWLCDVTKFVFGFFPKEIYILKSTL